MSEKRKMEKKKENLKENWMEMPNSEKLAKQRVCALDEYIHKHNSLAVKGTNKPQKVNAIMDHLLFTVICRKHTNKQTMLPQCGRGG